MQSEFQNSNWVDDVSVAIGYKDKNLTVKYLKKFLDHVKSTKDYSKPLHHIRGHAVNWIKQELRREKSSGKTNGLATGQKLHKKIENYKF